MSNLHDKIKKIHQLSISGIDGEMSAAKRLLDEICAKYNISIEDVISEKTQEFELKITSTDNAFLFFHCVKKIDNNIQVLHYCENKKIKVIETSKIKWLQIIDLYNFHKKLFKSEKAKIIYSFEQAYYSKHDLFCQIDNEEKSSNQNSKFDLAQFAAVYKTLENTLYLKSLQ